MEQSAGTIRFLRTPNTSGMLTRVVAILLLAGTASGQAGQVLTSQPGDSSSDVIQQTTPNATAGITAAAASTAPLGPGRAGDFDGDGKADIAVFRPSTGTWFVRGSSVNVNYSWGGIGDVPVPGDYDGDGKTDVAVFRPYTGAWYLLFSSTMVGAVTTWGGSGDRAVPADYDGDGKTDIAVFRPSTSTWYVLGSSASATYVWGDGSDIQVPADYDGDGKADIAIFRPSTGAWYILQSSSGTGVVITWGREGDRPVPADYDGDGRTDIAVWQSSDCSWSLRGIATHIMCTRATDVPAPGDYDGDGKADMTTFSPLDGMWKTVESTAGFTYSVAWGAMSDFPIFPLLKPTYPLPPAVTLLSPCFCLVYFRFQPIPISAAAGDPDGSVSRVDFYVGGSLIGSDMSSPYEATWTSNSCGYYGISAVAIDDSGLSTASTVVVRVVGSPSCSFP